MSTIFTFALTSELGFPEWWKIAQCVCEEVISANNLNYLVISIGSLEAGLWSALLTYIAFQDWQDPHWNANEMIVCFCLFFGPVLDFRSAIFKVISKWFTSFSLLFLVVFQIILKSILWRIIAWQLTPICIFQVLLWSELLDIYQLRLPFVICKNGQRPFTLESWPQCQPITCWLRVQAIFND